VPINQTRKKVKPTNPLSPRVYSLLLHGAGGALVVLLGGAFYGLVYRPLENGKLQAQDRVAQVSQLLLRSGSEAAQYRALRNQLDAMQQAVAQVQAHLREEGSSKKVVENLSKIAQAADLHVLDYQVGPPNPQATHTETELQFRCLGSYASICKFLDQAEQFAKTTKLATFALDARRNNQSYPIQLTFVLYSEGPSNDTTEKRGVL
jgi:Tfp pilus assembly protein PilO